MARVRSANPCAPIDEDVATMSLAARYVWAYLPCHADRDGRLKDSPFTIKANILPADNVDMNAILDELAERRHIIRYQVDGRRFIQIRSFHRHQSPHKREVQSVIPCPPGWLPMAPVHVPEEPGLIRAQADPSPASVSPSPGIPDPVPVPDLPLGSLPLRSSSSPPGNPAGARSNGDAISPEKRRWAAEEWFEAFRAAWLTYQAGSYAGQPQDWRAVSDLQEILRKLPADEAIAAQRRAPEMLAEYFTDNREDLVAARHPWPWFVTRFNGLRLPRGSPRAHGRSRTAGNIDALADWEPPKARTA